MILTWVLGTIFLALIIWMMADAMFGGTHGS